MSEIDWNFDVKMMKNDVFNVVNDGFVGYLCNYVQLYYWLYEILLYMFYIFVLCEENEYFWFWYLFFLKLG